MDKPAYDSFANLFPMPMTSIEKFHFWDSDPEYPNLVFCRLRIAGKLDPDIAKQAWQFALERQPFGDVEPKKINGRLFWIAGPRAKGELNRSVDSWNGTRFEYQEYPSAPPQWRIDHHQIRSQTGSYLGISVWPECPLTESVSSTDALEAESPSSAVSRSDVSEVWFYVHHAICDGAGGILVLNEWMLIYANLRLGRPPEAGLHRFDPALLRQRNSLGLLSWRYLKHLPKQVVALFGAAKFTFRKTVELIPIANREQDSNKSADAPRQFPAIIGRWVSESHLKTLSQQAKEHDVMLNSVLLGQLYIALARWRLEHGFHSDNDWMRIILPMSIRTVSDRRLPSANRATIVQLDRCGREMKNVGEFYKSVNREILIIRGWQLDKIFLIAIRCLSFFESFLKRAAKNEKSRGMAVFTNLGEPLRKSERASSREPNSPAFIRLHEFDPVGPIRKGVPVNFSASRYGSRMRIALHYDAQVLSLQQAEGLLTTYLNQLISVG